MSNFVPSLPLSDARPPIVVVLEDDLPTSHLLCLILERAGLSPHPCFSVQEATLFLKGGVRISAMLIDLSLPDGDGIEVLRTGRRIHKNIPCFVLTALETIKSAVEAMKAGAENYLIKPFEPQKLVTALQNAIKIYHGSQGGWTEDFIPPKGFQRWKSERMSGAMDLAEQAARVDVPTMLVGAQYTGRFRFAQLIHQQSSLKDKPMARINLAVLSPLQIETELFGLPLDKLHDAPQFARGKLVKCRGATLYLENIDRLHLAAQAQLLGVINHMPPTAVNQGAPCRILSSTSLDLQTEIQAGRFRLDLWYALSVHQIEVPSLAERLDDLPMLCENIITRICVTRKLCRPSLTRLALERLLDHSWPGNLSELAHCLEHAITRSIDGLIGPNDLPPLRRQLESESQARLPLGTSSIDELTKVSLIAALEACGGNRRRAAQRLKISLRTIYNMIERYELPKKTKPRSETDSLTKD
jgi:two-component system response regulator HydG